MLNTITRQIQNYKIKRIRISTRQKININPIAKLKFKSIKIYYIIKGVLKETTTFVEMV